MPTPTRRAVLLGGTAAASLTGCTSTRSPAPAAEPDPDKALVAEMLTAEATLVALVEELGRRPRRARLLQPTRDVHQAHVKLLTEADPGSAPTVTSSPSPSPALRGDDRAAFLAIARAEDSLAETLRQGAFRARSGPFARVLASMAAASAQSAATLRGRA